MLDKAAAVLRRDFLTARRTRSGVALQIGAVLAEVAAFYYLARAVGPHYSADGMPYYPFVLTGTALFSFMTIATTVIVDSVRDAQLSGTMEILMSLETSGVFVLLLGAASTFAMRFVHFLAYFAVGLLIFPANSLHANIPAVALVVLLSALVTLGIGLVFSAVQVLTQRGAALAWAFGAFTSVISGVLYPVAALPASFQKIALLNPLTHALTAFRLATVQGASWAEMRPSLVVLAAFAIFLNLLGVAALNASLRSAKRLGTLTLY